MFHLTNHLKFRVMDQLIDDSRVQVDHAIILQLKYLQNGCQLLNVFSFICDNFL